MIYLRKSKLYKHVIDKKDEILLVDYFSANWGYLEIQFLSFKISLVICSDAMKFANASSFITLKIAFLVMSRLVMDVGDVMLVTSLRWWRLWSISVMLYLGDVGSRRWNWKFRENIFLKSDPELLSFLFFTFFHGCGVAKSQPLPLVDS